MSHKIVSRLTSYWKLEAINAVILPLIGCVLVVQAGGTVSLWVIAAMAACSLILVIGAAAWRMELAQAQGDKALAERIMPWLAQSQRPAQAAALLGAVAAGIEPWNAGGLAPSAIAALVFGVLAVLEYVNYYVAQLQHFDHAPDLRRLLSGKGFRRPHLARAIDRWRKHRRV